jgi:hypothetical protein
VKKVLIKFIPQTAIAPQLLAEKDVNAAKSANVPAKMATRKIAARSREKLYKDELKIRMNFKHCKTEFLFLWTSNHS